MAIIERRKNAIKGSVTGLILQIFNLLIPFVIRTLFIKYIGIEYAGMDSLFASILNILNLAELGVGSALVFSMYKPIVEDDRLRICALMKLYKNYYRIIGLVVLVGGLIIVPALPYLIKGDIPKNLNLYVLYFINLGATVFSYLLFAYRNSLFSAYQRTDISNVTTFCVNIAKYSLQIVCIILWQNYYLYLIINLLFQLINNVVLAFVSTLFFPGLKPEGKITKSEKKEINNKVRDLFTSKLGGVIVTSADTIVISSFLGLTTLAVYNNYFYVLNAVNGIMAIFYNSIRAGVANELIIGTKETKTYHFYNLSFLFYFIIGICVICFLNLYQPFIELWVGKELLMDNSIPIFFAIYFFVYQAPLLMATYKDAAGIWKQDRFRPLIGAIFNLILNIILVNFIGIYGILVSTILSYVFISIPWLLLNTKKYVLDFSIKKYILIVFLCVCSTTVSAIATKFILSHIECEGILNIVITFLISVTISLLISIIFYFETPEFKFFMNIINGMIRRKSK